MVIVGYGPVGQTLAALLASKGHSVAVYERFSGPYELPRAAYFADDPEKEARTGLHHTVFEYDGFDQSTRATCGSRGPGSCRTSASTTG